MKLSSSSAFAFHNTVITALRPARRRMLVALQLLAVIAVLVISAPTHAANYPLELVSPRAAGSAPIAGGPAIPATNRIFKAYPGIEYNIRAIIVGGAYPYRFQLSGAPSGMTINEQTGEIRWPNPTGTTATPTITVTDAEGTVRTSPWTIAVTTAGFKFVDSVRGTASGTGTIDNPFRTVSSMAAASTTSDIVYFRSGTYNVLDMTRSSIGTPWERVEFRGPNIWIAYPGESPVVDFGFVQGGEPGVIIRFTAANMYLDGLETRNSRIIGLQLTIGNYGVVRRMRMRDHNLIRANLDGANAALIMMVTAYGSYGDYLTIQDSEFYNAPSDMALKVYAQRKLLIENNSFHDLYFGVELKDDMPQFTYRANRHYNIPGRALGGNMHETATSGEILFNLMNVPTGEFALDVNQDGMAQRIDIYRNTFVGRVRVRNTDSADGPFRFYNNVIVNNDSGTPAGSHIYHEAVSDASRITQLYDLTGSASSNIVDAAGNLTGSAVSYVGTRGYQVASGPLPRPPTGLTAQ